MSKKENELVTKPNSAVAGYDYGSDVGTGFEGTTQADLSIPFITVLQALSKVVVDKEVKGADSGMLYNTVTKELVEGEEGIVFIPCHRESAYVEWVPRDSGGGFVGLHEPTSDFVKEAIAKFGKKNQDIKLDNGNDLIETYYMYGLILDAEGKETQGFGVLSFSATKIKTYRDWSTAMYTLKGRPPLFANRAIIKTTKQKNKANQTYYNFRIEPLKATWVESLIDPVTETGLLEEAKGFREMVTSGLAKAAFETQDGASNETAGTGATPF